MDSLVRGWFPEGTRLHAPAAAKADSGGGRSEATLDFAPRADRLGLGATVVPLGGSMEGAAMSATGAGKRLAQRMLKTQGAQRQENLDSGRAPTVGRSGGEGESDDECESRSQSISKRKSPAAPPPQSKRARKRAKQAAAAARAVDVPGASVADGAPLTKNQRRKQRKREAAAKLKAEQYAKQAAQLAAQGVVRYPSRSAR